MVPSLKYLIRLTSTHICIQCIIEHPLEYAVYFYGTYICKISYSFITIIIKNIC